MYRSMFQVYVKNSIEAVETYVKAFGAEPPEIYLNQDGNGYLHSELNVYGQILSVSEADGQTATGNVMQLCLHFGEGGEALVRKAFDVLKEGAVSVAQIEADWSPLCFDITDRFGVRWAIFV